MHNADPGPTIGDGDALPVVIEAADSAPEVEAAPLAPTDPAAWEQAADEAARELRAALDALSEELGSGYSPAFRRTIWPQVREIGERIREAPAIKLEDKLALQRYLAELRDGAKGIERSGRDQVAALTEAISGALDLVAEALTEESHGGDVGEIRADLAVIRQRVDREGAILDRNSRQKLWTRWQELNQSAWERQNALWAANEAALRVILDRASQRIAASDPRGAREQIKHFHAERASHECSHRGLRELMTQANRIWKEAEELGKKKHDAYLSYARGRLDQWNQALQNQQRQWDRMCVEIERLEQQAAGSTTDVGAALLRGQIAERRRALAEVEATRARLIQQIAEAEGALNRQ